jgi:hypothetical protein
MIIIENFERKKEFILDDLYSEISIFYNDMSADYT